MCVRECVLYMCVHMCTYVIYLFILLVRSSATRDRRARAAYSVHGRENKLPSRRTHALSHTPHRHGTQIHTHNSTHTSRNTLNAHTYATHTQTHRTIRDRENAILALCLLLAYVYIQHTHTYVHTYISNPLYTEYSTPYIQTDTLTLGAHMRFECDFCCLFAYI